MPEGVITLPPDSSGKSIRTMTGGNSQPASTHQEVHTLADPDGTLLVASSLAKELTLEAIRNLLDADQELTGNLTALNQAITFTLPGGHSSWTVQLAGTFSATSQASFEGSLDNNNWYPLNGRRNLNAAANELGTMIDANPFGPGPQLWRGNFGGFKFFRVKCAAFTTGDNIAVIIRSGSGVGATFQNGALPTGTSFIGYSGNVEEIASKQGRFRFAGGKVSTTVAAPNANITLANPAGSNVDLILTRYQVEVDASADVVLISNATNTGTLQATYNPNQRTTVANPGEIRTGTALTGGTVSTVVRRATTNSPVSVGPFRFRIIPGGSFTVQFVGPGASNTAWLNMGWFVVEAGADLL